MQSAIAEELLVLERELLAAAARNDAARLAVLLSEDFREFGSSGRVYTRAEIIQALSVEEPATLILAEAEVTRLAADCALVTYRSRRVVQGVASEALRSSIWCLQAGRWRMRFHQGTPAPTAA